MSCHCVSLRPAHSPLAGGACLGLRSRLRLNSVRFAGRASGPLRLLRHPLQGEHVGRNGNPGAPRRVGDGRDQGDRARRPHVGGDAEVVPRAPMPRVARASVYYAPRQPGHGQDEAAGAMAAPVPGRGRNS